MTGPDQILIAALADAPATPGTGTDNTVRVGVVSAASPFTVAIQGGTVVQPGLLNGALAAVGDTVALLRQDSTWLCLGKIVSGNGPTYYRRITLAANAPNVDITGIPGTLRRLFLSWKATFAAGGAVSLRWIVNNDSVTSYNTLGVSQNDAAIISEQIASTAGYLGVIAPAGGTTWGWGICDWPSWSATTTSPQRLGSVAHNGASIGGIGNFQRMMHSVYFAAGPYTRLSFFADSGVSLGAGSDFQLEGYA
jgi:hypothetical protein